MAINSGNKKKKKNVEHTIVANRKTFVARHWLLLKIIYKKKKNVKATVFVARTAVVFPLAGFVLLATMQFQFKLLLFCTFHLNNFCDLFLF